MIQTPKNRISSDRTARINAMAVAMIVVVAGAGAAFTAYFLMNPGSGTYVITVDVTGMEVSNESGSVYNVMKDNRYYNPETGKFSSLTASDEAYLYASVSIGSKTQYTDSEKVEVQKKSDVPTETKVLTDKSVSFKVSSGDSSVYISFFLLLKGYSRDASLGSTIDIYEDSPGSSGIRASVELNEHTEKLTFRGNAETETKGLMNVTITVKAA